MVYEDGVQSEDEQMVYQGRLHSLDKTKSKHKSKFMDTALIEVGNLALLRMNDDDIAVAKIISIDLNERVIQPHTLVWQPATSQRPEEGSRSPEQTTSSRVVSKRSE